VKFRGTRICLLYLEYHRHVDHAEAVSSRALRL
jgi:hypothetical protein